MRLCIVPGPVLHLPPLASTVDCRPTAAHYGERFEPTTRLRAQDPLAESALVSGRLGRSPVGRDGGEGGEEDLRLPRQGSAVRVFDEAGQDGRGGAGHVPLV